MMVVLGNFSANAKRGANNRLLVFIPETFYLTPVWYVTIPYRSSVAQLTVFNRMPCWASWFMALKKNLESGMDEDR